MSLMLEFYGLREHPFGVSPNPRFLYPSIQHREALASLIFGVENQVGFAALIAEPGAGKTTLLFDVLLRYRDLASTAFVFNTQCSGPELLRLIVLELQIPGGESEHDPVRLHQLFTTFVADRLRTKPVVIIIDEAQNLEGSALEALRLLSNFEAADRKLLHIILAGQPQLGEKLRSPALTQLLQRITVISRIERLSPAQMEECISYRLSVAGYAGSPLFSNEAMAKITAASRGLPREMNRICINTLQLGFALRQKKIGVDVVDEALSDLNLSCEPPAEAPKELPRKVSQLSGTETKVSITPARLLPAARDLPPPAPLPIVAPRLEAENRSTERSGLKQLTQPRISVVTIALLGGALTVALVLFGLAGYPHFPQVTDTSNSSATSLPRQTPIDLEKAVHNSQGTVGRSNRNTPSRSAMRGPIAAQRDTTQIAHRGALAQAVVPLSSPPIGQPVDDRKVVLTKFVRPVYPELARKSHLEGDVSLNVGIASDGYVRHIRVISGDPVLVQAAKDAVQQWRYQPSVLNGTPVAVDQEVILSFREDQDRAQN